MGPYELLCWIVGLRKSRKDSILINVRGRQDRTMKGQFPDAHPYRDL